ncbi:MAG: M48 family metallopeptidase, partial [Planctomycetota bacterium]|nr:M48 family metallopeptidase [Planctomycetota bacterium]
ALQDPESLTIILGAAQLLGVATIFAISPLIIRVIWSTRPLPDGPLRDELLELCRRHRVGCSNILLWNTHGLLMNAAVIGVIGRLRYILLSDALLERLDPEQIAAVMAHEVGHVRRRHIPWLLISLIATLGLTFVAIVFPLRFAADLLLGSPSYLAESILEIVGFLASLTIGLFAFGFISRRFEKQADAFAVQHLSGMTAHSPEDPLITEDAVEAMAGALHTVALLNHIPRERFTWRHGSIAQRQRAIRTLAGLPVSATPIDRSVRRLKRIAAVAFLILIAVTLADALGLGRSPEPDPTPAESSASILPDASRPLPERAG